MRIYDLFSGIGGFRFAFEELDKNNINVGSCEINKYARTIYRKNFGEEPTENDVRMVDPSKLPDFDLLTAGFPCQSFSIAGKRLGFNDTRGTMFFEICRIIKEKRPQTLLLENVKGLLNHDRGRTFSTIITSLSELGYDVEWQVINGKYFVPQNRERLFIIGHLRGKPFRKVFPLGAGYKINDGTQSETQRKGKRVCMPYTRTIDSNYSKGSGTRTMIKPTMLKNKNMNGRKIKEHNEITFTLDTIQSSGIMVDERIRRLTPLECERLMGFPDGWTEGISDTQRYKCLGNAVIPIVVKIIGIELDKDCIVIYNK